MASEIVRQLIDSGIHFGHRASRWNPKMKPYIFGKRNLIHIIDIRETVKGLLRAKKFLAQVVGRGDDVLFVGTKRQARDMIVKYAKSVKMPYVSERWLGGTLTNFRTIRSRLARLEELEAIEADGRMAEYSKKQVARISREQRKIHRNLSGVREMTRLPGVLAIIDVHREHIAVREAKALGIPTVCLIDTDSDPDFADIPIPGNDDSMRSVETVLKHLAESVTEGLRGRTQPESTTAEPARKRTRREVLARADDGGAETSGSVEPPRPPESETESPVGSPDVTATPVAPEPSP